jgi:pyruvate-formate lyase-activating enzyme
LIHECSEPRTSLSELRRLVKAIARPVSAEKRAVLRRRWEELPPELRTGWQTLGRHMAHCGYTLGPSYCSLGCTHCYLPASANRVPIPTLNEMKEQIEANRRLLGPDAGLQITGGDVVDAYWRAGRAEELVQIVRHADRIGLVPMLMTHGQVLLEQPDYLERLVREGGLRKLALHVDITQAGRPGFPIRRLRQEADLNPLRDAFAKRILDLRRRTGIRCSVAHTLTVTERNLDSVAQVLDWLLADRRHVEAFGMISFQPEADVGRTRFSEHPVTPDAVWDRVREAVGLPLSRDNVWFGHPECSNMTTLAVLYPERRVIDLLEGDDATRRFWTRLLDVFGGVGARGTRPVEETLRRLALAARRPSIVLDAVRHVRQRLGRHDLRALDLARRLAGGRVRFLNVVMHNFMGRDDLSAPRSSRVEERLRACAFRGAVRRNGDWVAVPMCAMNVEERESIYEEQISARARP